MYNQSGNLIKTIILVLVILTGFHLPVSKAQGREKELDAFFAAIDRNGDISGSVLVAENGKTFYQKSFGYADLQNKISNTSNTLFQIASVSKLFTSIAVLQLYEQNKINLTDKLSAYFPDFPYKDVTINQLLSNTSGVPDVGDVFLSFWRMNRDTVFTLNDVIPALKGSQLPSNFKAGEAWEYVNMNFVLSALLIEKISGEKYAEYLSKNVFKPSGMNNTFQKTSGTNAYNKPNVAYNYSMPYKFSATPVRVDSLAINDFRVHYKTWPSEGDANIYTSVTEWSKFDNALFSGKLLNQRSLDLLFAPSIKSNGKKVTLRGVGSEIGVIGDFYWGLGNRISLDSTMGKIVWLSGGMPGSRANIICNLTKHQLIVWLDNKESPSAMDNVFGALNIINDKPSVIKKARKHAAFCYGQSLVANGETRAFTELKAMSMDTLNYILDEDELNELGYDLHGQLDSSLAFAAFRAAIVLFPESDNLYNSYGEVLAKSGKKEEAVFMYRKSLQINPGNEDSKKSLEALEKK